jgi:hypothetical protein
LALLQFRAGTAQATKYLGTHITQANPCICEFKATPFFAEQGHAKVLFQRAHLPAYRAMGHMQLVSGMADTVQAGGGFKGAKGIQRR